MPCLNEAETVARCVVEALAALESAGLDGEVVVADNGSTDGSRELAGRAGARVVSVAARGYGAALAGGFAAARGRYVVMGDADLSYDFGAVPDFVKALDGLAISEIPVTLRRDGRSRPPHLRTWRDGWRHLRFLLLYSPRWLFLLPGLALVLVGAALLVWLLPGPRALGRGTLAYHTMLSGVATVLVGAAAIFSGVCAKIFGITEGLLPKDPLLDRLFDRWVTLETGLLAGAACLVGGGVLVGRVVSLWAGAGFHGLAYTQTMRWMIPGVLLLVLGAQALFG